jgi:hypothetical protein
VSPRVNPVLGLVKSDILLCFGGVEEYDNFMSVEGFTLKSDEKADGNVNIFSPLDEVSTGSYRLILREDAKVNYKRLYDLLEKQGLIDSSKLNTGDDKAAT